MISFGSPKARKHVAINSALGLLYAFVNFPGLLERTIPQLVGGGRVSGVLLAPMYFTQDLINALVDATAIDANGLLQTLISSSFVGLLLYVLALAVLAIRRRDAALVGLGVGGLILGASALHAASWVALAVLWIYRLLARVFTFVFNLILTVLKFLAPYTGWFVLAALVILLMYLIYRFREELLKVALILAIPIGVALMVPFTPELLRWIIKAVTFVGELLAMLMDRYIAPIIRFLISAIAFVLSALLTILGVIAGLNVLGHLLVDQIKAAWYAGESRKDVLLAGFGIGSAVALLFLVCVGSPQLDASIQGGLRAFLQRLDNLAGTGLFTGSLAGAPITRAFVITMPKVVQNIVFSTLGDLSAPLFDALLLLVVLILTYIGILRRAVEPGAYVRSASLPVTFLPVEYLEVFGGLIVAVLAIMAEARSEQ